MSSPVEYDYIIIGVGTAGCLLANRLSSTDNQHNLTAGGVLALEAGKNYTSGPIAADIQNASLANNLPSTDSSLFWVDNTVAQFQQLLPSGSAGRSLRVDSGKTLGGGSSVNGLQYVRGSNDFFNAWSQIATTADWNATNAQSTFNALETFIGDTTMTRGTNGPLHVSSTPFKGFYNNPYSMVSKLTSACVSALTTTTSILFPEVIDYNDPTTAVGPFSEWQLYETVSPAWPRYSAANAFLGSGVMNAATGLGVGVRSQSLTVLTQSLVSKINFTGSTATSVTYMDTSTSSNQSKTVSIRAGGQIILCAGRLSPQLLMQSGIGPGPNIGSVYQNADVGLHVYNHSIITATFDVTNAVDTAQLVNQQPAWSIYTWGAFLPESAVIPSSTSTKRAVQLIGIFVPPSASLSNGQGNTTSGSSASSTKTQLIIAALPVTPKSEGSYTPVDPTNLSAGFNIDYNMLTDARDLTVAQGILKFFKTFDAHLQSATGGSYIMTSPAPADLVNAASQNAFLGNTTGAAYHNVGGCTMHKVVDETGHVIGVNQLIVADDSICPVINDGNTSSTAYWIASVIAAQLIATTSSSTTPTPTPTPMQTPTPTPTPMPTPIPTPCFAFDCRFDSLSQKSVAEIQPHDCLQSIDGKSLEVLKTFKIPLQTHAGLVRFQKDSLGDNVPSKDTTVTEGHLIQTWDTSATSTLPARTYVNKQTIEYVAPRDGDIFVYHVLVDSPYAHEFVYMNNMRVDVMGKLNDQLGHLAAFQSL